MLKSLLHKRVAGAADGAGGITGGDIEASSVVLFSVFGRYGDGVIAFKVIGEFLALHPGKKYILITTHQLAPYARRLLPDVEVHSVNIRKEPLRLLKLTRMLKGAGVDLGFNPWSHGEDSEYFITFAKKFLAYKANSAHPKEHNLYARIREYLLMEPKGECAIGPDSIKDLLGRGKVHNVVIAPFSKDVTKSLSGADLARLVKEVEGRLPGCAVTVALDKADREKIKTQPKLFLFGKSLKRSEEFLALVEGADLFIGVDAGPLHLADALGVSAIGIFGPTAPETVLDTDSRVAALRDSSLKGLFCFVRSCTEPACIHRLFMNGPLKETDSEAIDFEKKIRLEEDECMLGGPASEQRDK
jgi:ADP-heptose:LPS heptosyltransferase